MSHKNKVRQSPNKGKTELYWWQSGFEMNVRRNILVVYQQMEEDGNSVQKTLDITSMRGRNEWNCELEIQSITSENGKHIPVHSGVKINVSLV